MTTEEFSNEFDTLIQSYLSVSSSGELDKLSFDEYEKSVFLTKALEDIIIAYYSGDNPYGASFEETELVRKYLNELVKTTSITQLETNNTNKLNDLSVFYLLPTDIWFITYELVKLSNDNDVCLKGKTLLVTPVTQDEYWRTTRNPFRLNNKNRVLRLDVAGNKVELISKYPIASYLVRYISKPSPIVLTSLTNEGIDIDGVKVVTECKLNSAIHRLILNRAIELALTSKGMIAKK